MPVLNLQVCFIAQIQESDLRIRIQINSRVRRPPQAQVETPNVRIVKTARRARRAVFVRPMAVRSISRCLSSADVLLANPIGANRTSDHPQIITAANLPTTLPCVFCCFIHETPSICSIKSESALDGGAPTPDHFSFLLKSARTVVLTPHFLKKAAKAAAHGIPFHPVVGGLGQAE